MNKRPDFSELRKEIAKLLEDQHGQVHDDDDADLMRRDCFVTTKCFALEVRTL